MGGKWSFRVTNRHTLDLQKYQTFLITIRDEFESLFAHMNPEEGRARWSTPQTENVDSGNAGTASASQVDALYNNNIFVRFYYTCTIFHGNKGPSHGIWTLYWNPKLFRSRNKLHARCAPQLFKELSNQIQEKLVKEFPEHFSVRWENGISGYESEYSAGLNFRTHLDSVIHAAVALSRLTTTECNGNDGSDSDDEDHLGVVQEFDLSNNHYCPHLYPWGHCPEECEFQ